MSEVRTNAARRLHTILRAMQSSPTPVHMIGDMIAYVFQIPKEDIAGLYRQYSSFLGLIGDVQTRLEALDDSNKSNYLTCLRSLKEIVKTSSLQTHKNQFFEKVSESDLALLALAATRLDAVQTELLISPQEIQELQNEVAKLFSTLAASDLDPELRIIVLDLLEAIKRTLSEYQIRGAEGLKRVLAECLGRMTLDRELVVQSKQRPEMKSFLELLGKLNGLFTAATNADKIGQFIGDTFTKLLR